MPSRVSGDFSMYPASIREVFPMVYGECCMLREAYSVYFYLFMAKERRTETMGKQLGGVLGIFQQLAQDDLFSSIARLTDKDSRVQRNLGLSSLLAAADDAGDVKFKDAAVASLDQINLAATDIRQHRHKRLAHFDLSVSLEKAVLPVVTFEEIRKLISQIEAYLNLFAGHFDNTTILFDAFSSHDITYPAEVASYKAMTYDILEAEGVIPKNEWRKRAGY